MKFSELVRTSGGERLSPAKEKGLLCEGGTSKSGARRLSWFKGSAERHEPRNFGSRRYQEEKEMIDLPYSLVIEATDDPEFFGFYSPELQGFTGVGHSVEDCLYRAKWGKQDMQDHLKMMREHKLSPPPVNAHPS